MRETPGEKSRGAGCELSLLLLPLIVLAVLAKAAWRWIR
jgi:hypothetical protein